MEKLLYLVRRPEQQPIDDFRKAMLDRAGEFQRLGAQRGIVNISDLLDDVGTRAPGRIIGDPAHCDAVLEFWLDSVDNRGPLESLMQSLCRDISGYLVTESVVQPYAADWGKQRRPGVTQFGAMAKPEGVSEEQFYRVWSEHSRNSFELHPLRQSYIRNAIARPLTENAAPYRALVLEHFSRLDDFVDDARYFGSEAAVATMMEEVPQFVDFNSMLSLPMSEYSLF